MFQYIQTQDGVFLRHIKDTEPTQWDENNYCLARNLTDEQVLNFGVVKLKIVTPPYYNPATQQRVEGPALLIDGVWTQQYVVTDLSEQEKTDVGVRIKAGIVNATQQRLDHFAQTRNYDGILSLCTYASSPNVKFQAEGQYGVEARDATWSKLYEILAEVEAGTRPMPTGYSDIEPELPPLVWPN